ncbi:hypothetical protein TNCV_3668081 [Trichonephila clavipes]|nr:hypothetical protein TNCV_3668081 [Trichonephila clavipes]
MSWVGGPVWQGVCPESATSSGLGRAPALQCRDPIQAPPGTTREQAGIIHQLIEQQDMLVRLSGSPVLSGGLRRKLSFSPVPSTWPFLPRPHLTSPKKKFKLGQCALSNVGLWSGKRKEEKGNLNGKKRAENREGSLGFPGFVERVYKTVNPLGRRGKGHFRAPQGA